MVSGSTPDLLALIHAPTALRGRLAMLCLSNDWGRVEEQTLILALALEQNHTHITLIVAPGSELQQRAEARQLVCYSLRASRHPLHLWAAARLLYWLRREQVGVLITTSTADLSLAYLVRRMLGPELCLVHRQVTSLAPASVWQAWATARHARTVDAWLAPLPAEARRVQAQTGLDRRRLWVVPPTLPATYCADSEGHGTPAEARRLLDLPAGGPLLGVVDCGGDGPVFAMEVLYRLREEYGSKAEMVLISGPDTPSGAERWTAVRALSRRLGLSPWVHLRPLHHAAAPALFHQAIDVLLLPAPENATDQHLLAAMASGCPLVSTVAADAADLLQDGTTARLFAPHDVAACAQAILATLWAPDEARQMAARASMLVQQQCSSQQQIRQIGSIIQYLGRAEVDK